MRLLSLGFRNLSRRKSRTILTIIGIFFAIGFTIGLLSISEGFIKSTENALWGRGPDFMIIPKGTSKAPPLARLTITFPEDYTKKILKIKDITVIQPTFQTIAGFGSFRGLPAFIMGIYPESFFHMRPNATLEKGRFLKSNDRFVTVIGKNYSENSKLNVGDEIELPMGGTLKVVGILKRSGYLYDYFAYAPIKTLQKYYDKNGQINSIMVKVKNIKKIDKIIKNVKTILPNCDVQSMEEIIEQTKEMLETARITHVGVSAFSLIIGILFISSTMIMSVSERVREFATLRAIGASKKYIVKLIMCESLMLSLIGGIIGILFGALLSKIVNLLIHYFAGNVFLKAFITPRIIFVGFILSIIIGSIAGVFPAITIMKKDIAENLRYE